MKNTAVQKPNDPEWLKGIYEVKDKFLAITGKERETAIELGFATQLINDSEKLRACDKTSIMNAIINVARTGITLNPVLNLAYLVPRGGKCCLHFDYKGLVKLLKDYNCIKDIQAVIVYDDEVYEDSINQLTPPKHIRKHAKTEAEHRKREYFGVYSKVVLFDNTVIYTSFMPYWEVLKAEKMSPGAHSEHSPWKRDKWRESMIMKTKVRVDCKLLISGNPDDRLKATLEVEDAQYTEVKNDITNMPKAVDLFAGATEARIIEPIPIEQEPTQAYTIDVSTNEGTVNDSFFTSDELSRMDNEDATTVEYEDDVKQKLEKGKELRKKANI